MNRVALARAGRVNRLNGIGVSRSRNNGYLCARANAAYPGAAAVCGAGSINCYRITEFTAAALHCEAACAIAMP